MKILSSLLLVVFLSQGAVFADLYSSNNPFQSTTNPQTFNNYYESQPNVIQEEEKQAKKSWFKKGKKLEAHEEALKKSMPQHPDVSEGVENGKSFYVFK